MKYLGWIVCSDGFRADPEYVHTIREMEPPTTKKALQSLIGHLVWIRQFLETCLHKRIRSDTFSNLMGSIHKLNKTNKSFTWTERANKAFKKIKDQLSSPPVISFPDYFQLFTLTTDVSDIACGAILMQEAENGRKKIIAVASHTFNATEQNWSMTEREAYAIKWVISKFDYFLRNRPFIIFTDHRLLTYLDKRIFNNAKIQRWQEEISDYKFILEFVEGELNIWADMLSRSHGQQKIKTPVNHTLLGKVFQVEGSDLHIYVPSWCLGEIDGLQLIPKSHSSQGTYCHKRIVDAFFAYHSTTTIPTEKICDHLNIAAKQSKDDLL